MSKAKQAEPEQKTEERIGVKPFHFMPPSEGKERIVNLDDIDMEFDLNVRFDYDIPSMVDWIVSVGFLIKRPLLAEVTDSERPLWGTDRLGHHITKRYVRLQGHRRLLGLQHINLHPDKYSYSLYEMTKKVLVVTYSGLNRTLAESIIMDHGSEKPLHPSELIGCVYRLFYSGHNATEIMSRLVKPLAAAFRVPQAKVHELDATTDPAERMAIIRGMFQNVINSHVIRATQAGPWVAEQVLRHFKKEDGLLPKEEPLLFKANGPAIRTIMVAVKEDQKIGQFEGIKDAYINEDGKLVIDGGGPNSRGKLEEMIHLYFNPSEKPKASRMMTSKDVKARQDSFKSKGFNTALQMVLQGETDANTVEIDAQAYRLEKIETIAKAIVAAGGTRDKTINEVLESMQSAGTFQRVLLTKCDNDVAKKAKEAIETPVTKLVK